MSSALNERATAVTTSQVPSTDPANDQVSRRAHWTQLLALTAILFIYAGLSHLSASTPNAKGLGAALSVGPVVLVGIFLAWRWTRPLVSVLIIVCLFGLLYRFWPAIKENYEWADLVQQSGAYALVALGFARSLMSGRTPLCTQLAEKMHGALTAAEITYTRRATVAWAIFYALMTAAILGLFFVARLTVWSFFVNFVTFGLILLVGIVDHLIRRRILPRHPTGGILSILQRALIG